MTTLRHRVSFRSRTMWIYKPLFWRRLWGSPFGIVTALAARAIIGEQP